MILYPEPVAAALSVEQVSELDDSFFASKPTAYFRSRLESLLSVESKIDHDSGVARDVAALIGDSEFLSGARPNADDLITQQAIDSFSLRHHIAEATVRVTLAVLQAQEERARGARVSTWWTLAAGPVKTVDVVSKIQSVRPEVDGDRIAELFGMGRQPVVYETEEECVLALRTAWNWILRACAIVSGKGVDANSAHNKIKHGFATRAASDLRLDLFMGKIPGDTIGESEINKSLPLISGVALEFISSVRRGDPASGSIESTAMVLDPVYLLAEAASLLRIYGAIFATAARSHFGETRSEASLEFHPGLTPMAGPRDVARREPVSIREPLTFAASGGAPRNIVLQFGGTIRDMHVTGPGRKVTVVAD